ncbi:MAG: Hsp33 family molecular chaperone HslO [Pseudobdellovibrionaceae bacterium]|nr:Hsp33 family molecular chaperone HslO [Pseudobdellovibrionaceae bacterium]
MLKRFVANDFTFRLSVVDLTPTLMPIRHTRSWSPLATEAIGKMMTGAILMASHLKPGQGVGLLIRGEGALKKIYAEAYHTGEVRAYCSEPQLSGFPTVEEAIGGGLLSVTRHQPFQKSPFHGNVPLVGSTLDEYLEHYLLQSQQIRSIMTLSTLWEQEVPFPADIPSSPMNQEKTQPKWIGGYLLEIMPGVEDHVYQELKKHHQVQNSQIRVMLPTLFSKDPSIWASTFFNDHAITEIDYPYSIRYECPCSLERVLRSLTLFEEEDIEAMIQEGSQEIVTCQMCGEIYHISQEHLETVKSWLKKTKAN